MKHWILSALSLIRFTSLHWSKLKEILTNSLIKTTSYGMKEVSNPCADATSSRLRSSCHPSTTFSWKSSRKIPDWYGSWSRLPKVKEREFSSSGSWRTSQIGRRLVLLKAILLFLKLFRGKPGFFIQRWDDLYDWSYPCLKYDWNNILLRLGAFSVI